jgi:hypothetical protein
MDVILTPIPKTFCDNVLTFDSRVRALNNPLQKDTILIYVKVI